MTDVSLLQSTGSQQVDRLLQGIVGMYTLLFAARIRAFYVTGSYADRTSVSLSDIDLCIVFAETARSGEMEQVGALASSCAQLSPLRLDIFAAGERELSPAQRVLLKRGGLLVFGEDIRDDILLPPLDAYQKEITWGPPHFLGRIIRDCAVLSYPLTYPDSTSEFYGYERKRVPEWYPSEIEQGTKELVTGVLRTATAIITLKADQYVGSKHDSVRLYCECIHDEWADYIKTLYQKGKREWSYLIPTAPADRLLLRSLCERTLAFENAYFSLYRSYLLTHLRGSDNDKLFALERLTRVIYSDPNMLKAVQELGQSGTQEVRQAARDVLPLLKQ